MSLHIQVFHLVLLGEKDIGDLPSMNELDNFNIFFSLLISFISNGKSKSLNFVIPFMVFSPSSLNFVIPFMVFYPSLIVLI